MENHFYHIRLPPFNVTIFITHVHNCVMGATPMMVFFLNSGQHQIYTYRALDKVFLVVVVIVVVVVAVVVVLI